MEMERKEWSALQQFKQALAWEGKALFIKTYIPAAVFLCLLIVIGSLPREVCDYLRIHAMAVVAAVNIFFGFVTVFSLFFLPAVILSAPYGDSIHPIEKTGDVSEKSFLAARLLYCVILTVILMLAGILASGLMEKFATESVGWFQLSFTYYDTWKSILWTVCHSGFWKQVLFTGLVQPLVFLWIFLCRLRKRQQRLYVSSYILAMLLSGVLEAVAELQFLHFAPEKQPPVWVTDGIWFLVMLGSIYAFLRMALRAAEEVDYEYFREKLNTY